MTSSIFFVSLDVLKPMIEGFGEEAHKCKAVLERKGLSEDIL